MSRIVDGKFIFGDAEKTYFRSQMRKLEKFMGLRIVTYCLMSNHFHILVEVPAEDDIKPEDAVSDKELVRMVKTLYGAKGARQLEMELANCDQWGFDEKKKLIRHGYLKRRGQLKCFMQELKQRFSRWYNKEQGRRGTLWEERFKSVIVGNSDEAILTMAAYIDLNPVRAMMVSDPADYAFSGYGEACAGRVTARKGLAIALERSGKQADWNAVSAEYRKLLFGVGEEKGLNEDGSPTRPGFTRDEILAEVEAGGQLPLWKALRCRIRYFADGGVFGSDEFLEQHFERKRSDYSAKRQTGARKMRNAGWGGLRVLRDLRVDVFG